ncbi:MAG: YqiA/YcfP family alpha/beta fold hydrolase [Azonexus sp.]
MSAPRIIYLHGFCSSPASLKSRLLGEYMAGRGLADRFVCPQLSTVPDEAIADIGALIEAADGPVTLVGSSLGGHYANHLAEKYGLNTVLINPAVVKFLDAALFIGDHTNFHSGEHFTFTAAHAAQLAAQVSQPTPGRYWLLSETGDEVLDWRQAAEFYAGNRQTVLQGGDHSFTRFAEFMPQILEFSGL